MKKYLLKKLFYNSFYYKVVIKSISTIWRSQIKNELELRGYNHRIFIKNNRILVYSEDRGLLDVVGRICPKNAILSYTYPKNTQHVEYLMKNPDVMVLERLPSNRKTSYNFIIQTSWEIFLNNRNKFSKLDYMSEHEKDVYSLSYNPSFFANNINEILMLKLSLKTLDVIRLKTFYELNI